MRKIVWTFFCCVFLFGIFDADAQRFKGFSGSTDTYMDELNEMIFSDVNLKGDKKKEYEVLLEQYRQAWNNFNIQHRKDIVRLSQQMFKKNARARSGFYGFIQTQIAFQSSNQSPESYNQWLKGMSK